MKKVILTLTACAATFAGIQAFTSCNKSNSKIEESKNYSSLQTIQELGKKYEIKGQHSNLSKDASTQRKVVLVLADAVGGVLGSAGGVWGAVWGGFFATLGVEGYVRDGMKVANPINPVGTNSTIFEYGVIGDGHNLLMFGAYGNDTTTADIDSNNIFNFTVRNLVINTPLVLEPNQAPIATIFQNIEPFLVANQKYIINHVSVDSNADSTFIYNIIINSLISSDAKNIISTIAHDICTLGIASNSNNFTSYLAAIEATINSSNYSTNTKKEVKVFLAVANSSNYFWQANLIQ